MDDKFFYDKIDVAYEVGAGRMYGFVVGFCTAVIIFGLLGIYLN